MQKTYWVDPDDEDKEYSRTKWVRYLRPQISHCFYCGKASEIIHLPLGTLAFNHPRYKMKGVPDHTDEFVLKMAEQGWKVQLNRAYCPECKGLGRV